MSSRSEEHTSELQSRLHLVCRLLLEKKDTDSNRIACAHQRVVWGLTVLRWPRLVVAVRRPSAQPSEDLHFAAQVLEFSFFLNDAGTTEIYPLSLHARSSD